MLSLSLIFLSLLFTELWKLEVFKSSTVLTTFDGGLKRIYFRRTPTRSILRWYDREISAPVDALENAISGEPQF